MKRPIVIVVATLVAAAALLFAPTPFDSVTRIRNATDIEQPASRVYDYVTTPGNWPRWHPSSKAVHGTIDHSLQIGEQVTEDFRVAGREGRVIWTVVGRTPPSSWKIAGEIDGRPAGTVQYQLAEVAGAGGEARTHFEREFDYAAPNLLFAILNQLSIRSQIEAESTAAVLGLKRELEAH